MVTPAAPLGQRHHDDVSRDEWRPGRQDDASAASSSVARRTIVPVIALTLVAHVLLLLHLNINWDEFFFLSFVYDYARGTLDAPLQTFHVHLFGWLPGTGGQEVDQIIVGRAALLLLLLGTCACVYRLARRLTSVDASLFAVMCCAGYSNILYHGSSFRTDGLSVFLLMFSLVLVQSRVLRLPALAAGAVLVAVALLITVKSAFFLPTIGVLLVTSRARGWYSFRTLGEAVLFATVLLAATLGLYLWHKGAIAGATASGAVAEYLESSAAKVITRDVLFPRWAHLQESVRGNLVQWGFLIYAVASLGRKLLTRQQVVEACSMLALVFPLLSLVFYRNAFPYFYVFLMPPALVLCAVTFDELRAETKAVGASGRHITVLATLVIGAAVVDYTLSRPSGGTAAQRDVIAAVHDIFPEPVPYVDRNGMIASFPKVGFFMSSWGMESYRTAGRPVFADLLRTHRPGFLIANSHELSAAFGNTPFRGGLLDEDAVALRDAFVPYWGPIYVAGKKMRLTATVDAATEVLSGGSYGLESEWPVAISGSLYAPGAEVILETGTVIFRSAVSQDIVLRTTAAGGVPLRPAPTASLYTAFPPNAPRVRYVGW
jgi:hypothetical protein